MPLSIQGKFGSSVSADLFTDAGPISLDVSDGSKVSARIRLFVGEFPVNLVAPSIAGDTGLGDTLTVTAGTWSGVPAPTLAYQWLRDGVEIAGETGTTYDITLADSGALIAVRETATNSAGSASEVSNAITADTFTAPDAFTAPDWDVANDGETVSVNIITLPADGGAPITDLEYRVNAGAAISLGETTTGSYPITADDGDDIQVRAVNGVGAGDWSDVKAVPSGAFDPATLFASGEQGAWYDPSDLSTMFTDTDGTTPAAVGDPVARINDKSGRGNHATQATAAARPILRQTAGGLYYLEFDGVDDCLLPGDMGFSAQNGFFIGYSGVISGTSGRILNRGTGGDTWLVDNRWRGLFTDPSLDASGAGFDLAVMHVGEYSQRDGVADLTRNGVTGVSASAVGKDVLFNNMRLMSRGDGAASLDGKIVGLIIVGGGLSGSERAQVRQWMADRAGVTL